jgi:hypothetical protein
MVSDLNLRLASVRISTVASAYGLDVRERGLSRCVFHDDKTPSMSVSPSGKFGADLFNCFGCGAAGDVVGFLSRLKSVDRGTAVKTILAGFSLPVSCQPSPPALSHDGSSEFAFPALDVGEDYDYKALSRLRGISVPALKLAASRGLLRFGRYANERAWVVVDVGMRNLQYRPLRSGLWFGKHKALSAKGASTKSLLGVGQLSFASRIHLVEGGPDLLAAHQVMTWANPGQFDKVAAVAFLGASIDPSGEDCGRFLGKDVVIWAHSDGPGLYSAKRKLAALTSFARSVSVLSASDLIPGAKDLNDIVRSEGGHAAICSCQEVSNV